MYKQIARRRDQKTEAERMMQQNRTKANQQLKKGRERKAQKQSGEKQPLSRAETLLAAICPEGMQSTWTFVENQAEWSYFPPLDKHHQVSGKQKTSKHFKLLPLQLPKLSFIYYEGLFDHPGRLHSGSEYWWVQSLETQPNVHASPRWSDFIFYYSQARAVMYQLRLYSFLLHKSSLISQLIGGKQTHSQVKPRKCSLLCKGPGSVLIQK